MCSSSVEGKFRRENNNDGLFKRTGLLSLVILVWWLSEVHLRPLSGGVIQQVREYFGENEFIRHLFSQSLPVDVVCFVMLVVFCSAGIIPKPNFQGSISKVFKEGTLWGLLICVPVIPLALHLGFELGFTFSWQKMLGNVISNSYEELTYRVFLFSVAAYALKSIPAGALVSAVLFALIHNQYPVSMQIAVGLAALFFSAAYIRSGTIFAALWAHQLSDMILDSILI